jgi:DNA-binding LacI/PurR family transcriptional regulator
MSSGTPPIDGKARLEDVARLARVSRSTASRAITGAPGVSEEARAAVGRAARRLNYRPNRAARSLVTRRTELIGLVIPEPTSRLFGDPHFPRLIRGVNGELAGKGLQLVLFTPQTEQDEQRLEGHLASGQIVDGVLFVSLHGADPLPARLARQGVPVVVSGRPFGPVETTYVDVDNLRGGALAARHLLAAGRRVVATITGPQDMVAGRDRLAGYRQAMSDAGLLEAALEELGNFTQESGHAAMRALLERQPDLDAVFAASDQMALGAMRALREAGRHVPGDVAVVGFDDSPAAASADPPLSSVRWPLDEMAREMTRLLFRAIEDRSVAPRGVLLATHLVPRASSAPHAASGWRPQAT